MATSQQFNFLDIYRVTDAPLFARWSRHAKFYIMLAPGTLMRFTSRFDMFEQHHYEIVVVNPAGMMISDYLGIGFEELEAMLGKQLKLISCSPPDIEIKGIEGEPVQLSLFDYQ